jgi:hypothetical protein
MASRPRFSAEQIQQMIAYYRQFGTVGDVLRAGWTEGTVGYVPTMALALSCMHCTASVWVNRVAEAPGGVRFDLKLAN